MSECILPQQNNTNNSCVCDVINDTTFNCSSCNVTACADSLPVPARLGPWMTAVVSMYAVICVAGAVGNVLVIYVIVRYAKMKSVTNTYILNLAISDFCFLVGLPFLIVTAVQRSWIFGPIMCKVFYALTAINWYTSIFTLTVLSADRYFAICHAVGSLRYRTRNVANGVCVGVWLASFLAMIPVFLYSKTIDDSGRTSCTIDWPDGQLINPDQAFIWYTFGLGFALPVALICVFYGLVVFRLRSVGPKHKTQRKKRSHKRVTHMVLAVVTVYIVCWLPYWISQTVLLFIDTSELMVLVFQLATILSYANSALNPLLYAFISDNFRNSFCLAFHCQDETNATTPLLVDHTYSFPGRKSTTATLTLGAMATGTVTTLVCAASQASSVPVTDRKAKVSALRLKIHDVDEGESGSVLELEELLFKRISAGSIFPEDPSITAV